MMICSILLIFLMNGRGINSYLGKNTTDVTEPNDQAEGPRTRDDFVILYLNDYVALLGKTKLKLVGNFEDGLWMVDLNGTDYLFLRKSKAQQMKELDEAIERANGSDTVCGPIGCLDKSLYERRKLTIQSRIDGTLHPSQIPAMAGMSSVLVLVGCLGVVGNLLILSAVVRSSSARSSTNILMGSLAFSDIIVLCTGLPLQVIQAFYYARDVIPQSLCKLIFWTRYFSIAISVLTMSTMAVERYIAICHPLQAKRYCTVKNTFRALFAVWVFSAAVCIPVVFMGNRLPDDLRCRLNFRSQGQIVLFNGVVAFVVLVIPVAIMVPLYVRICRVLWKSAKDANELSGSQAKVPINTQQSIRSRKQVVKMLIVVLVMFLLSWGPSAAYGLINSIVNLLDPEHHTFSFLGDVSIALSTLGICNSLANPVIYTAMSRQYQAYLKSLCKRKAPRDNSSSGTSYSKKTEQESISKKTEQKST